MMDLWSTRRAAMMALEGELREQAECVQDGFDILDECIQQLMETTNHDLAPVAALLAVKGRNLLLGC